MMNKKKRTVLSVYDLEGEMIDVILRVQQLLAKLQSEGYSKNTIEFMPEDDYEYAQYIVKSER